MPFIFKKLDIPEVQLIEPRVFPDGRGFFLEIYKHSDFTQGGNTGTLYAGQLFPLGKRGPAGAHYQKHPHGQGKLVRCVKGSIFDVAVDIRKGSSTYGKWVGAELTEENNHLLYVPVGFAHGFQVLSDFAEVLYKCTTEYYPVADRGIQWNDPDIAIQWPMAEPLLSNKDTVHPLLKDADNNYTI